MDTFKMCFRSFYDANAGGVSDGEFASFEEGHNEIVLCESVVESAREEKWVTL